MVACQVHRPACPPHTQLDNARALSVSDRARARSLRRNPSPTPFAHVSLSSISRRKIKKRKKKALQIFPRPERSADQVTGMAHGAAAEPRVRAMWRRGGRPPAAVWSESDAFVLLETCFPAAYAFLRLLSCSEFLLCCQRSPLLFLPRPNSKLAPFLPLHFRTERDLTNGIRYKSSAAQ